MLESFCTTPSLVTVVVLAGAVKMRRGQTACMFDGCDNMGDLLNWFLLFLDQLESKVGRQTD
jgi:farnesyl-diphosphate farnesyltransferase